jgi:hypothetical protein
MQLFAHPLSQRLTEFAGLTYLAIAGVMKSFLGVFLEAELSQDLELDDDNQWVDALLIQDATEC